MKAKIGFATELSARATVEYERLCLQRSEHRRRGADQCEVSRKPVVLALACAAAIAGCGSSATPSSSAATNSSQPTQGPSTAPGTSAPAVGSGSNLVVTGSLSLSLAETPNSANMCQPAPGSAVSGILIFGSYDLQFSLPIGTTQFPQTPSTGLVAFFNGNDSTQEWAAGTNVAKTAAGTATVAADGKSGTVDVDMLPDPPTPNPALKPIHVKGTWTCS